MMKKIIDWLNSNKVIKSLEEDFDNLAVQFEETKQELEALKKKNENMSAYDFISSNLFGKTGVDFFDYDNLEIEPRRTHQRAVLGWVESNTWQSERDHMLSSLHKRILELDETNAEGLKLIKELIAFVEGLDARWKLIAAQFRQEAFNDKTEKEFKQTAPEQIGIDVPGVDLGN